MTRYYRCRCGIVSVTLDAQPPLCRPCVVCETVPATSPDSHPPPVPHQWTRVTSEAEEGEPPTFLTKCYACGIEVAFK